MFKDFKTHFINTSVAAVEISGYRWFLNNVVNNAHGGWPLAVGSDRFIEADFNMATVSGK